MKASSDTNKVPQWLSRLRFGRRELLILTLAVLVLTLVGIAYAAPIVIVDDQGADDYPGQKDLSQLTVDYAGLPNTLVVSWNWDDTAWSGSNTGDACSLYDTDGDGNANYSLCVTVRGSPARLQSTRLYSCGDSRSDRCDQPTVLIPSFSSTCTASVVANSDPFGVPTSPWYDLSHVSGNTCRNRPGCYTADTVASCTVQMSDFGAAADVFLINVCSYPAQEPNSAPSECVVTPDSGFLTIVKDAGDDTSTDFTFNLGAGQTSQGGDSSWTITGSGSVDLISFSAGTYDLSEVIPEGWNLDSAVCNLSDGTATGTSPTTPVTGPANAGVSGLEIQTGRETTCTFADIKLGNILVDKVTDPSGATVQFEFDSSWSVANFFLRDGDAPHNSGYLVPGTYSVAEVNIPAGWDLTDSYCSDGSTVDAISLQPGETITCTFEDTQQGKIIVVKNTVGGDGTFDFTSQSLGDFSLTTSGGTASTDFTDLQPGIYDVDEVVPAGWDLTSATCDDGSDPSAIDLGPGETVTCTFLNTKLVYPPDITVTKTADPTSVPEPGGDVTFTVTVVNNSASDATLDSLVDDIYGDLDGEGTCDVPQSLPANGGSYTCSFIGAVSGNPGESQTDTVTAVASNEAGSDTDFDSATVEITDVPSSINVTKSADPTSVDEPGGTVQFTVVVENTSTVDTVTLDQIADDEDNDGTDDTFYDASVICDVTVLAPGEIATCIFSRAVSGEAGDVITDEATASGTDDDNNPVSDSDTAEVTIADVESAIQVVKTAMPDSVTEPGDDVTFSIIIYNLSTVDTVTIESLIDTIYGDLTTASGSTCVLPQDIAPGDSYTCSLSAYVSGNAGDEHTNVATASGVDDDGVPVEDSDDATVDITDVPSAIQVEKTATPDQVSEPGGDVTFSVTIRNLSTVDTVTIDTLEDTIYGDLNGQGDCAVPQVLLPGDNYSCSFTALVSGNAGDEHTNVVTASGSDDDNQPVSDSDDATVTVTDVPSAIEVIKTADPTSVSEPGDDVTYTFTVNNLSAVDSVTIDSLTDTVYGDLNGQGDCVVPQTIPAGGSYTCSLTVFVGGDPGDVHTNVVTASGIDDDGNAVSDDDEATVTVEDVPSEIEVIKTANPTSVDEPGGGVTYTFTVNNLSSVDAVTIDSLVDTMFGDLDGQGNCALPQTIPAGGSYTCSLTVFIAGEAGQSHTNVVTASGTDDDGNSVEDSDDATVTIEDVPSGIEIVKTASPTSVPEPGGDVTYTFTINNLSEVDAVTLDSLIDTVLGDLDGQGTCDVPQTIAVGGSYTCEVTVFVGGNAGDVHYNVVTASGTDDDGVPVEDSDDETVTVIDVPSAIEVIKTADPTSVPEPGDDVTYTFTVNNLSTVDAVTLDSLTDTILGDLNGQGDCAVPQTIAVGGSYTCEVTVFVGGNAGDVHTNVVTAAGTDDDGVPVEDTDDATVTVVLVPQLDIDIEKSVSDDGVAWVDYVEVETGADIWWQIKLENDSNVEVDLTWSDLLDGASLDLSALCSDLPSSLDAGDDYTCVIGPLSAEEGLHTNVVSVEAGYEDLSDQDDDDASYLGQVPATIDIKLNKQVSTADQNWVDYVEVAAGADIWWRVRVRNDSNVTVDLSWSDELDGAPLDLSSLCPDLPSTLAVGDSYMCIIGPVPAELGEHTNVVSVEATYNNISDAETNDASYLGTKKPAEPGTITIEKRVYGKYNHSFRFIFDDVEEFYLADGETKTFGELDAGAYIVAEDKSSFPDKYWALFKVTCEGNSVPVEVDLLGANAKITLQDGENITCVFHNQRVNEQE